MSGEDEHNRGCLRIYNKDAFTFYHREKEFFKARSEGEIYLIFILTIMGSFLMGSFLVFLGQRF